MENIIKTCSDCKIAKTIDQFHKKKSGLFGVHFRCKECRKLEGKARYYDKREHIIATASKRYETKKDEINQYKSQWYEANKDHHLAKSKEWRDSNKEYKKIKDSQWKKANRGLCNALHKKRKVAQNQAIPPWFEKDKVDLIYKKAKEWGFQVDHVIPLQGKNVCGLHCWSNLQLLDSSINASKNNKFISE